METFRCRSHCTATTCCPGMLKNQRASPAVMSRVVATLGSGARGSESCSLADVVGIVGARVVLGALGAASSVGVIGAGSVGAYR
eukprot:8286998-Pyramimonas_sp.AAC.1